MDQHIVIFASGNGSNAQAIAEYLQKHDVANISLIMSNRHDAYVLERAKSLRIPSLYFSRTDLYNDDLVLNRLIKENPSLIVLAGFLWLLPVNIISKFPDRIVNIHPALLPAFGGKGMYGSKVHEAVIATGCEESGITIHYVNERYDEGDIIFQARCEIFDGDTPESLAQRIHQLEHFWYPRIIEKLLTGTKITDQDNTS